VAWRTEVDVLFDHVALTQGTGDGACPDPPARFVERDGGNMLCDDVENRIEPAGRGLSRSHIEK
jgi:hypothetical protein